MESAFGRTLYDAQVETLLAGVLAYREALVLECLNEAVRQQLVAYATGIHLEELGALLGVSRLPASAAMVSARLVGPGIAVPMGSRFGFGPLTFQTSSPQIVGAEGTTLPLTCTATGPVSLASGAPLVDLDGLGLSSVTTTSAASGGADIETDAKLRARILLAPDRWCPGNAGQDALLSRHSAGNLQIGSNLIMTEQGRVVTDCNAVTAPGCWGLSGTPTNGPSGGPWSPMLVIRNIDVGLQLAGGYNDKLHFRGWTGYGDLPGEWTAWREVIHSGNISTQAVASATSATTATTAASLTTIWQNTPALDLNTMGLGRGNNYNTPSMWTNGPAGVSYGSVYNLGGASASSLSLQILADVNHNVANSTKSLYFRTGNNLGFQADWKEIWHTGNLNYEALPLAYTNAAKGTMNSFTTDGGPGADAITRSCFIRDNGGQFGNLGLHIQHPNSTNYAVQLGTAGYGDTAANSKLQIRFKDNGTWKTPYTFAFEQSPSFTGDVNAVGFSGSWGSTPNTGYRTIMGTGASATWLCYGTSGGTLRGGIQLLDAGGQMRIYAGSNWLEVSSNPTINGNALWHAGNLNPLSVANSDQTMRYVHWDGYNRSQLANTLIGPRGLLYTAIAAGKPLYGDEEFALSAWVGLYNNAGGSAVTLTWESDATAPNKSGKRVKITYDGVTLPAPSPGLGGFITPYTHRTNAVIVQRFIAKIPVGFSVVNAENSPGTNGQVIWITPTAGTGKWEEYIRVVYCGDSGTFSSGGHVYLSGTGNIVRFNQLVTSYANSTDKLYVPIIDAQASGSQLSNTLIYSADIAVLVRVRQYKNIIPFEQSTTIGSTGLTVSAIRAADTIAS